MKTTGFLAARQQRQGTAEILYRLQVSVAAHSLFAGPAQIIGCLLALRRPLQVFGNFAQVFLRARGAVLDQPFSHQAVISLALALEYTLIGHFAQQSMFENKLARAMKSRNAALKDHLALLQMF